MCESGRQGSNPDWVPLVYIRFDHAGTTIYLNLHPSGVDNGTGAAEHKGLQLGMQLIDGRSFGLCSATPFSGINIAYATEIKSIQLPDFVEMVFPWDSIITLQLQCNIVKYTPPACNPGLQITSISLASFHNYRHISRLHPT